MNIQVRLYEPIRLSRPVTRMRRTLILASLFVLFMLVVPAAQAAPPTVTIESPEEGETVEGNITVEGSADDPDATGTVEQVEVRIDDGPWRNATDNSTLELDAWSSWTFDWNTTDVADGNHTITARATDDGDENATDTVNVTVDNQADDGDDGEGETPPADVNVTIEARQSGCPDGRTFCLEVTEGNLSGIDPGLTVNATYVNPTGNFPHSLYFADHEDADPNHTDTPAEAAYAQTNTTQGGEAESARFTVPDGADTVYVWCDESQHEAQGMYLHGPDATHDNGTDDNGTDDDDGTDGTDGGDDGFLGLPGFGPALAGLAAASAALALRRKPRT